MHDDPGLQIDLEIPLKNANQFGVAGADRHLAEADAEAGADGEEPGERPARGPLADRAHENGG